MEIPEKFKRPTPDKSLEAVLKAYTALERRMHELTSEVSALRADNALLDRQVNELSKRVTEYQSRDHQAALLASLAAGAVS